MKCELAQLLKKLMDVKEGHVSKGSKDVEFKDRCGGCGWPNGLSIN